MNTAHLQRKIAQAEATRRFWIDKEAHPFPTANFWCGASIDLDISQGFMLVAHQLNSFMNEHESCPAEGEHIA